MPPRRSPNDYAIAKATQDELLRAAVSNDANIARARKLVRLGEVEKLSDRQSMSPEERLRDSGIQESEALSNLLRMGFRQQEASQIVVQLDRDERATLNGSYPEIKRDLETNYDVKLITPTFFLTYFRKFKDRLMASRGVRFYGSGTGEDSLINSADELEELMPSYNQLSQLYALLSGDRYPTQAIEYWMRNVSINPNDVRTLPDVPRIQFIQEYTELLRASGSISRNQMQTLLDQWRFKSREEKDRDYLKISSIGQYYVNGRIDMQTKLLKLINDSRNLPTDATEGRILVPNTEASKNNIGDKTIVDDEKKDDSDDESDEEEKETEMTPIKSPDLSSYKDYLYAQLGNMRRDVISFKDMKYALESFGYKLPKGVGKTKFLSSPDTYIAEAVAAKDQRSSIPAPPRRGTPSKEDEDKEGSGMRLPRMKLGRGLSVKQTPSFREFGKYAINLSQLENNDKLIVKYKSLGPLPKFKPVSVSDLFRDFLLDIFENGKPNKRVFSQLDEDERRLFEDIATGAGLWSSFGLKRTTTSQEDIDDKDFELLRGEYLAGNNNPQVIVALRRLVVKMMTTGRMKKSEGMDLLMELSV